MTEERPIIWNCEMEVNLFHALRGHKPVGVNRHFHMVSIYEKLVSTCKKITAKQIWDYLGELYDLNALNESEIVPFPNKESDFSLPDTDFSNFREKLFPCLALPKQDTEKQDEKVEKLDKTEKQDKADKHEKPDKHDKHDKGSTKLSKSESRHSTGTPILHTPDNSPKRKRTRHTPSSTASPATPDAPPPKRRR